MWGRWMVMALLMVVACEPAGEDGDVAVTPASCPDTLPGPTMVRALLTGGNSYCIDSSEVNQGQYDLFLQSASPGQGGVCAENQSFQPLVSGNGCDTVHYDPEGSPDTPVVCVDWCDAAAYCEWSGKHLCGAVDGGTVPIEEDGAWDASISQWYNACSDNERFLYPYGDNFDEERCNSEELGMGAPLPVASLPGCVGYYDPYNKLYDMSGNVAEWEDACGPRCVDGQCPDSPSYEDYCFVRGGSFEHSQGDNRLACNGTVDGYPRATGLKEVGFRCCL